MTDFIVGLSQVMRAEVDSLNAIAQNSSNINTAGYKSIRSAAAGTKFSNALQASDSITTKVNAARGQVNITDRPLDLAIIGDGWFGIQHNNGIALTKNGNFKLNAQNVLTTLSGEPVLGANGPITLPTDSVSIDPSGELITNTGEKFKLAIYDIDDSALDSIGGGLYTTSNPTLKEKNIKILQGALEASNVDSASDMVRMMETTRHIESMQRAINTYNELLNTGINQIGK